VLRRACRAPGSRRGRVWCPPAACGAEYCKRHGPRPGAGATGRAGAAGAWGAAYGKRHGPRPGAGATGRAGVAGAWGAAYGKRPWP